MDFNTNLFIAMGVVNSTIWQASTQPYGELFAGIWISFSAVILIMSKR